ncbi:Serine hydrolase, partial [Globisporangium splendens]
MTFMLPLSVRGWTSRGSVRANVGGAHQEARPKEPALHFNVWHVFFINKWLRWDCFAVVVVSMEESEQGADEEKQQFSWWNYQENENGTHSYSHVEESLEYVAAICREQGPFDGVFGFSQGGMLAHLMLQRHHENPENSPFAFSFGIFVSSPTSLDPHYGIVDYKLSIPSVHVIGETDVIVAPERCKKLTEGFVDPTVILHDGGHYIRTNKEVKDAIRDLLKKV